jgi:hypothetical protein
MTGRARWVVALLVAGSVLVLADLFVTSQILDRGQVPEELARRVTVFAVLISIATVVAWMLWQHASHKRLHDLGVPGLTFTPGWAVGWWFIPFANLFKPFQAIQELWQASEPVTPGVARPVRSYPLIIVWWVTFLVSRVLAGFVGGRATEGQSELEGVFILVIPGDILTIAAAVLAAGLVHTLEERIAAREQMARSAPPVVSGQA